MTVTTRPRQAWDTSAYHRIVAARHDAGELVVDFEDGTRARVSAEALLPPDAKAPDWTGMRVDRYEIVVPTEKGLAEIPWLSVRLMSDPAFDAHWAALAAAEARIIGERIAGFRRERGMGRAELARRAELSEDRLAAIEDGRARASFATLERVLAPLGRGLDDLAGEGDEPAPELSIEAGAAG